jgi:hypothetical protein
MPKATVCFYNYKNVAVDLNNVNGFNDIDDVVYKFIQKCSKKIYIRKEWIEKEVQK